MNLEAKLSRCMQSTTIVAEEDHCGTDYLQYLETVQKHSQMGGHTAEESMRRAATFMELAAKLERRLLVVEMAQLSEEHQSTIQPCSMQTQQLKNRVCILLLLAYLETEQYRLRYVIKEDQQYRRKYQRLLSISVSQLRIRMAFEDEEFEHYLIRVCKELQKLPYGTEFICFFRMFIESLELNNPERLLAEVIKEPTQPKQELEDKPIQIRCNSDSLSKKMNRMEEEAKLQLEPEPIVKPSSITFKRTPAINGRTMFYRAQPRPTYQRRPDY